MKLTLPKRLIKSSLSNCSAVIVESKMKGHRMVQDRLLVKNVGYGISGIIEDRLRDELTIQLSAKVLKSDYLQGVCLNTIERVFGEIRGTKLIDFNTQEMLLNAVVRTVDVVDTIQVEDIQQTIKAVVLCASMNSNYKIKSYGNDKLGYEAIRDVKSYKERQIGYAKELELRTKCLQLLQDYPSILNNVTSNTLRVESNFNSFDRIRKVLNVHSNKLEEVLNSQENVNLKVLSRMVSKSLKTINLPIRSDSKGFKEMRDEIGYQGMFSMFNGDLGKVESWIKSTIQRKNHSYAIKQVREAYARNVTGSKKTTVVNRIKQLSELLKTTSTCQHH